MSVIWLFAINGVGMIRRRRPAGDAPAAAHGWASGCLRKVAATHLAAVLVAPLAGKARFARMFFLYLTGLVRHVYFAGQAGDADPGHGCPPLVFRDRVKDGNGPGLVNRFITTPSVIVMARERRILPGGPSLR